MKKIRLFLASIFMILFAFSCGAQVNNSETEEMDSLGEKTEKMNSIGEDYYGPDIIPWERNGKIGWVLAEDTNKVVIPFEYDAFLAYVPYPEATLMIFDDTKDFLEHYVGHSEQPLWAKKKGKWGTIEGFGGKIPFEYDGIEFFEESYGYYEDMFVIIKDGLKGCASNYGEILVPCEFDSISREGTYLDGGRTTCIIFGKGGKYGAKCGDVYAPCVYDEISYIGPEPLSDENESNTKETGSIYSKIVFKAAKDGKRVFINDEGVVETKLPLWLEDFEVYGGIYLLKKNGKWGVMEDGICSDFNYDSIYPIFHFVDDGLGSERHSETYFTGFYYVYLNGKKNIMASNLKPILNSEIVSYKLIPEDNNFYETWPTKVLLVKNKNNYWGIINGEGKQIVPCKYDKINPLEGGCFELVKGKKLTKVNAEGKPCK
jgi:hypothetical protein